MYKTVDLLNRVKAAYGLETDYQLGKKMGIARQRICKYRNYGTPLDDKCAFIVADLLDLDPARVVASMQYERALKAEDTKMASFWMQYAA